MISQRPQVLNKNILTQAQILCALRMVHPKDIDAIEEWVNVHGDPERAKEMISSLPSLPIGVAWFWSPGWGDIFTKVKIRLRETFDSSATPEVGKRALAPQVLAPVDIKKLGAQIQETVQKAKENDPRALRQKIAELEKELRRKSGAAGPNEVQKAVREALEQRDREQRVQIQDWKNLHLSAITAFTQIKTEAEAFLSRSSFPKGKETAPVKHHNPPIAQSIPRPIRPRDRPPHPQDGKLRAGAERMLAALVQWFPQGMSEGQMRSHAGLRKSGTFSTYLSDLRGRELVEHREGILFATQAGMDYFGGSIPASPSTTEEVLAVWEPKLGQRSEKNSAGSGREQRPTGFPR